MVDDVGGSTRTDSGLAGHRARSRFDAGRAAWPRLELEFEPFRRYFERHSAADSPPAEVSAGDMYLACACSQGLHEALSAFERTFGVEMERAIASIDASRAFVDETMQVIRERLFVPKDGQQAKIADYGGRASLKAWLNAVAVRTAISLRRRKSDRPHEEFAEHNHAWLVRRGPELEYLQRRYKDVFEDAVRRALGALPAKERMLLRLNLVNAMSVDKLAKVYGIGRSTAARWLASARTTLLERTHAELCATLRIASVELDSLAAAIRSQLDVSLLRLLADTNR